MYIFYGKYAKELSYTKRQHCSETSTDLRAQYQNGQTIAIVKLHRPEFPRTRATQAPASFQALRLRSPGQAHTSFEN